MSEETFFQFSSFIENKLGIKMPLAKKTMLESRLMKRLRELEIHSYEDYRDYVFSPEGSKSELVHMVDEVTTNETNFFREPAHFEYLAKKALPELLDFHGIGRSRPLEVWSAPCSSGEEPFSLAMVISEYARTRPGYRFSVLGTDISSKVLEKALRGVYSAERAAPIPGPLKRRYLRKNKDRSMEYVRIAPELRAMVRFRRLNLIGDDFDIRKKVDIIFCRNLLIYFNQPTQALLIRRLYDHLHPGGYLFLGHSETMRGLDTPLHQVAMSVYRRETDESW